MNIKLIQSGGLLGLNKEAEANVDLSKEEFNELLEKVSIKGNTSPIPDNYNYTIENDGIETPVDIDKATGKHAEIFEALRKKLQVAKK